MSIERAIEKRCHESMYKYDTKRSKEIKSKKKFAFAKFEEILLYGEQ